MTEHVNRKGQEKVPATHYYQLNPSSENGKRFLEVLGEGMEAERKADALVKSCDAIGCVSSLYADFGGVTAFGFKQNVKPDPDVFLDSGQTSSDGLRLYEPNVKVLQHLCVWEKMPEENDNLILSNRQYLSGDVMKSFPRKMIAEAIGMPLKYMHPLEALRLLNIPADEVREYATGEKTVEDVLKGKMFVSKRDKENAKFAMEGEKENMKYIKEMCKYTYGTYLSLHGSEKAKALYRECQNLPIVPEGTLNSIVGLEKAKARCGFFIYKNWIWVRSGAESTLELNDDWKETPEDVWMKALKEAKKLYGNGKYKKNM